MKKYLLITTLAIFCISPQILHAQSMLDRLKQKAKEKVSQRADDKIDKAMDKGLDNAEGAVKKSDSNPNVKKSEGGQKSSESVNTIQGSTLTAYSKYDFIPGDKIIFQDDLKNEKDGDFPSQFNASGGQGQVFNFQGENVFQRVADNTVISPRIKGMSYLPEQYTVEFDAFIEGGGESVVVNFVGTDNYIDFFPAEAWFNNAEFTGQVPAEISTKWYPDVKVFQWRHFAIAVNKNLLKAYIDQFRVLNVPNFSGKATSVSFDFTCHSGSSEDCRNMFMKNFRIASGGIDVYKKIEMDGKIVTHGITFDIDKATIKPESMGTLNSIADLLNKNSSLNFEIDGHTDNSGTSAHNITLSEARANSVKNQLVKMGIAESRLTTKGFGDSKPLTDNNSAEGKANNRRVEFIKK